MPNPRDICGDCGHQLGSHKPKCMWPKCHCLEAKIRLTVREVDVLRLAAHGMTRKEIGNLLCISEKTADCHLTNIRKRLGFSSTVLAVLASVRAGLVSIDDLPQCDLRVYLPEEENNDENDSTL